MARKAYRYIVIDEDAGPLATDPQVGAKNVLWNWGDRATVFGSRNAARSAIRASNRYAKANDLPPSWDMAKVRPVRLVDPDGNPA